MLANPISATEPPLVRPQRAHLIGAGGAGMRALADVLRGQQWIVTGSDLSNQREPGILVGHRPEHVPPDADLVIYSEAVAPENCEWQAAARRGIPTLSFPQMLGRLSRTRICLAVAGTHGKSTVTAMAAAALVASGLDPLVIGGGAPLGAISGGRAGKGPHFLVEACEYRAHFLHLNAQLAVLLGIEPDHFDCFPTPAQQRAAFARFAEQTAAKGGFLLASAHCPTTLEIVRQLHARHETLALEADADWQAGEIAEIAGRYEFSLCYRRKLLGRLRLRVPGRHNVTNALAAAALAHHAGAKWPAILDSLCQFPGVERRFEQKRLVGGLGWIDDYAHHPTEVKAALATVRQIAPQAKVWCVFQPHQASRTKRLLGEFAESLQNADKIAIAEIFRAREEPHQPGDVIAADLAAELRRQGRDVLAGHRLSSIKAWLGHAIAHGELTTNDIIITMGAGDIGNLGYELSNWTRKFRTRG